MQKSTIKPRGVRSLYPLDFNKNNPSMEGFPEWRQYIRDEALKAAHCRTFRSGPIAIVVMPVEQLDALIQMESMRLQAEAQLERARA
ncbi:hypothetical protein [Parapedobacter indicus]|uniref:Uncharacterized protein n=1 Tax=Parapedobacter indicus TaxID=1477437 RepID=A0A1I3E0U5_9SPHI|nr:hypothetical protein [Parapedobacter indicus]PPL04913.1 hypothetical protein CLV26_101723 [Parapedobacter indicus]SFH92311.1 hypothetical protein SAMN05444682_101709 [Parapedobacter indicus]